MIQTCYVRILSTREQIQQAREAPPCILKNSNTTVDDGYVYPKNATEEEKAAIDTQEYEAWLKAEKPGSRTIPTMKALTNNTKLQLLAASSEDFILNYSGLGRFNL